MSLSNRIERAPVKRAPTPTELVYREADAAGPAVIITRRASDRIRAGHLWVYRSEVESVVPAFGFQAVSAGSNVTVLDNRQIPLGSALFSDTSQITLRLISPEPRVGRGEYLGDVRDRLRVALRLREDLLLRDQKGTDSCRLVFSEADNLPGIIVDRYNDLAIVQLLTQGTAQEDVREVLREELVLPGIRAVIERPDPRVRALENLPASPEEPLYLASGMDRAALRTVFELNGLRFHYDANSGQKTGAFLDQRLNYAAAASFAHGRALDVCTYQGGFALHLAQRCKSVLAVDASRSALEVAEANLELNRERVGAEIDWIEADAFELLRSYAANEERFDTVVLDPPAFAKNSRAVAGALRGYKELNLRALQMLRPGGTLVTCSCSHHISLQEFTETVASASSDSGRRVRLLETRAAAPDHPEVMSLPETRYLKCLILRVDGGLR